MKEFATYLVVTCGSVAVLQWGQIIYRVWLFLEDCHGERWANHIGNGDFALIYTVNALLLLTALFALKVLWEHGRSWRIVVSTVAAVNCIGWVTLFVMHSTGVLVEYNEYIRHMRNEI